MRRWEILTWAGILAVCLVVGIVVGQWAAPEPVVGVVRFEGAIDFTAADQLVTLLERARQDPAVAAVVLEIRSPGGIATSSENIFYSMLRLRAEKPLVVVIDGMAASGGYYMAVAANRIYAPASAYVGNIGTRGPRPQDPYISPEELSTGPYKLAGGSRFDQIYQLDLIKEGFVNNVIAQRLNSPVNPLKLDKSTVEEGRLYLGSEAVAVGLIDLEGARSDGILGAAELAGLRRYRVVQLDDYLGLSLQLQPNYMETISQLAATAAPDTIFLLDTRIALPGMIEGDALEKHMLHLRAISPASWDRTSERDIPRTTTQEIAPESSPGQTPGLMPAPAKEGS
ncbi:MAG: S49 family peptidase [Caldilineaceae bacterium]|nr:S49 family peptidase [Caldilineaceae bacterium]